MPTNCLRRDKSAGPNRERLFFNTQLGAYAASLLVGNLFSSANFIIDVAWIMDEGVQQGKLSKSSRSPPFTSLTRTKVRFAEVKVRCLPNGGRNIC